MGETGMAHGNTMGEFSLPMPAQCSAVAAACQGYASGRRGCNLSQSRSAPIHPVPVKFVAPYAKHSHTRIRIRTWRGKEGGQKGRPSAAQRNRARWRGGARSAPAASRQVRTARGRESGLAAWEGAGGRGRGRGQGSR